MIHKRNGRQRVGGREKERADWGLEWGIVGDIGQKGGDSVGDTCSGEEKEKEWCIVGKKGGESGG